MHGRLAFTLNGDGTVTLRCDADAFFSHADEIRRLLTGAEEGEGEGLTPTPFPVAADPDPAASPAAAGAGEAPAPAGRRKQAKAAPAPEALAAEFVSYWDDLFPNGVPTQSRDLSRRGTELLVAGHFLTRLRGFEAFTRKDLNLLLEALAASPSASGSGAASTGSLIHLHRRGWLERVRRGAYRLSRRALDRVASLMHLRQQPPARGRPPLPSLPNITGLSRFLREVPANRKWRRVLLVAYFLAEHCGIEEFDHRLLAACFQRLRGLDAPGSLPALISQVLYKRHGLLERGSRRGMYRLSALALEQLRRNPRVADADAIHRAQQRPMARTG